MSREAAPVRGPAGRPAPSPHDRPLQVPSSEGPPPEAAPVADGDADAPREGEAEPGTGPIGGGPGTGTQPSRGTAAFLYGVLLLSAVGFFLAPLVTFIVWRLRRHEPFVDFHGRQALDLALGVLLGAGMHLLGRLLSSALGTALQWAGLAVVALQGLLVVWGMVDAGQGRMRRLPLRLPVLRPMR